MTNDNIATVKRGLIADIEQRLEDKIIEQSNADLLKKLITNAENADEAIAIAALGTTYKRTGFHFDKRLEKIKDTIKYFKKDEALSFVDENDPEPNKLIIGDNYDALLNLLIQYKKSVDVIYIDPPYGKDSMGEFAATNYNNAITRDNLLSMLYSRLEVAKLLLNDTGLIFVSIDDRNHAYVKCLMDELFHERNFITSFVWQKKKGGGQAKYVYEGHEYVLAYALNKSLISGLLVTDLGEIQRSKLTTIGDKEFFINDDILRAKFGKYERGTERRCHYEDILELKGEDKLREVNEKLSTGEYILLPSKTAIDKHYVCRLEPLSEGKKKIVYSILTRIIEGMRTEDGNNQIKSFNLPFDDVKPIELVKLLLCLNDYNDSLVLDFFAGSGTTGQAVLELNREDGGNRKFVLCQLDEDTEETKDIARNVTAKRLKRAMTGKCYDGTADFEWIRKRAALGGSLDVYEIASVFNAERNKGKTPFGVIDETLYGQKRFDNLKQKVDWVCTNFQNTQKTCETDSEWEKRVTGN